MDAIPHELYCSVAVGIGLFIAFLGLRSCGIIVANPVTAISLGNLRDPKVMLSLATLAIMAILYARGTQGAILLGILASTAIAAATGMLNTGIHGFDVRRLGDTAFQLDIRGALGLGILEIVFVFFFVDLFDNLGTLVAVTKRAGLLDGKGRIPRLSRILTVDAVATVLGSLAGTSTVVSYIESAAGVAAGGRSGVVAIVTGLLFLAAIPLAGVVGAIPPSATAPALILVGAMMMSHTAEVKWDDPAIGVSSFLTMITIPLSFSIATGLGFGFISYVVLMVATGRGKQINWLLYLLTAVAIFRFAYLNRD